MNATRTIALAAALGTLAGLARVPFAALPSVQPASALVILAGAAFGWRVGLLTGVLVPLVSNALLGHGPWTLFQMLGWGAMGAGAVVLGRRPRRIPLVAYSAVAGLAFGVLMDTWLWLAGVRPLALHTLVPVLARGLPFNIAHAVGNGVILWVVGPRLATLLRRAHVRRIVVPFTSEGRDPRLPERSEGAAPAKPG